MRKWKEKILNRIYTRQCMKKKVRKKKNNPRLDKCKPKKNWEKMEQEEKYKLEKTSNLILLAPNIFILSICLSLGRREFPGTASSYSSAQSAAGGGTEECTDGRTASRHQGRPACRVYKGKLVRAPPYLLSQHTHAPRLPVRPSAPTWLLPSFSLPLSPSLRHPLFPPVSLPLCITSEPHFLPSQAQEGSPTCFILFTVKCQVPRMSEEGGKEVSVGSVISSHLRQVQRRHSSTHETLLRLRIKTRVAAWTLCV